jgi:indole-3-acetate monooxygenase
MNKSNYAARVLKQKQIDTIRDAAPRSEKDGKLAKAQLNIINDENWFRIFSPSSYGGLQLPLPDGLQILEALAWADGSTGWAVTKTAIAGWLTGFFNPDIIKEINGAEKIAIAGNETTGTAEKTKTGYTVNGKWRHASQSADAAAFFANCVITQGGQPLKGDDNKDQKLTFLLLHDEVTVSASSNAIGLAATSNNDFEAKNLKVPAARAVKINGDNAKVNARLFQYPFLQLTEAAMAVNMSGMAFHFIDTCFDTLEQMKGVNGLPLMSDNMVEDTFEKHLQKLNDARVKLFYAVELTWQSCVNQQPIKDTILYKVSSASQDLTRKARECVDALFPFCGLDAMDKTSEINRVWRDLHTASHEPLLVFGGM